MAMPGPGPVSIGQARNEMQQGNPINAGNGALCQLAGVSPGQRYAWSYWWGKKRAPPPISGKLMSIKATVDRNMWLYFNLATGALNVQTDGDGRTTLQGYTVFTGALPQLNTDGYTSGSIWVGEVRPLIMYAGGVDPETGSEIPPSYYRSISDGFAVTQQPAPGNGWVGIIYLNDNGGYSSGGNDFDVWFSAQ